MNEQVQKSESSGVRTVVGRVVSNKMDKTIVVLVERKVRHPKYKKYVKRTTKLHAHDAENTCQEGAMVSLRRGRPISKKKHWVVDKVL